ncbi:MAG: hypothetical protein ACM3NQ_18750 [Bacteroidales bacterium]
MRRFLLFSLVFALVILGVGLVAQDDRMEVEAQVGATYQEADEGYFSFGQDAMVVSKPGSALQKWLKAHVGQRVTVKFEPKTAPASR